MYTEIQYVFLVNSFTVVELCVRVCVCACTKADEKQEGVPAHAGCSRPQINKFNFNPACKPFAAGGWLSEEARLTPLTSQLYCCFCSTSFLTVLLMLHLLRPQEVDRCSSLAQCEQHLSFASYVTLSPPGEEVITL